MLRAALSAASAALLAAAASAAAPAGAPAPPPLVGGPVVSRLGRDGAGVRGPYNNPTPLVDSTPYADGIADGAASVAFYSFIAYNFTTISVICTPGSGNPDVFAHVLTPADTGYPPNTNPLNRPDFWTYSSQSVTGIDVVLIRAGDVAVSGSSGRCVPTGVAGCPVWIAVVGAYNRGTQFSLTATDGRTGTVLLSGVPQIAVLAFDAPSGLLIPANFTATVPPARLPNQYVGLTGTISITPVGSYGTGATLLISSDSTLYGVNCGNPTPTTANASSYYQSSGNGGVSGYINLVNTVDTDTCLPLNIGPAPATPAGNWYFSIAPPLNPNTPPAQQQLYTITWSICAQQPSTGPAIYPVCNGNGVQQLTPGVPAGGAGAYLQTDQYLFNAYFDPAGSWNVPSQRTLRINVLPLVGALMLYANVNGQAPTASSYQYVSDRFSGENEIVIRANDTAVFAACGQFVGTNQSCPVRIAVLTATVRSQYQLTASLGSAFRLLNAYPVVDQVGTQSIVTYYFVANRANAAANFYLSTSSGFAYMLLGSDAVVNTSVPLPSNPASYFINSLNQNAFQQQALRVQPGDLGFCAKPGCVYYLTVSGGNSTGAAFTVEAKQDGAAGSTQLLVLNIPTLDALDGNPSGATDPSTWNAYILGYPQASFQAGQGLARPTDSVTVVMDVRPARTGTTAQPKLVARLFTIPGNTSSYDPYGLATGGVLDPNFWYGPVTPDVGATTTQIVVRASDPQFNNSCAKALKQAGTPPGYNISCYIALWVLPDTGALPGSQSYYALTPFSQARQITDGNPVTSACATNAFTYFRYTVGSFGFPTTRPLVISVVPLTGDADLYVSIANLPNLTSSLLRSNTPGAEVLVISWDSATIRNAIPNGGSPPFDVYIGVYGFQGPATFTLSASTIGITQLLDGRAVGGYVAPLTLTYFYFFVPRANTTINSTDAVGVRLQWQAIGGTQGVVVLVNNQPRVNSTFPALPVCSGACKPVSPSFINYVYSSLSASSTPGTLDIEPNSGSYRDGINYMVGVYSPTNTTFVISAGYLSTIIPLQAGVQTSGTVPAGKYVYYSISVNQQFTALRLTLQAANGVQPVVYSSLATKRPNATSFGKSARATATQPAIVFWNSTELQLDAGLPASSFNAGKPCQARGGLGCTLYLSVYGGAAAPPTGASFTITAIVIANASYTLLQAGVPVQSSLPPASTDWYQIVVTDPTSPISVTLSPTAGAVDMYATIDGSDPSATNFQFFANSSGLGIDFLTIAPSYLFTNQSVKVAVVSPGNGPGFGPQPAAQNTYFVWYNTGDANAFTQLPDGVALPFTKTAGSYYFYYTTVSPADITFSLTPFGNLGDSDLFVSNYRGLANNTAFRPGPNGADPNFGNCGNSTQNGADFVTIPQSPSICPRSSGPVAGAPGGGTSPRVALLQQVAPARGGGGGGGGLGAIADPSCRNTDPCTVQQTFILAVRCYQRCAFSISGTAGYTTPQVLRDGFPATLTARCPPAS